MYKENDITQQYYTADEVSKILNIKYSTLLTWVREGKYGIPVAKFGHQYRFPIIAFEQWRQSQ